MDVRLLNIFALCMKRNELKTGVDIAKQSAGCVLIYLRFDCQVVHRLLILTTQLTHYAQLPNFINSRYRPMSLRYFFLAHQPNAFANNVVNAFVLVQGCKNRRNSSWSSLTKGNRLLFDRVCPWSRNKA